MFLRHVPRLSRPGPAPDHGQLRRPQTPPGEGVAGREPADPRALHADLRILAEPGRGLVRHHRTPSCAPLVTPPPISIRFLSWQTMASPLPATPLFHRDQMHGRIVRLVTVTTVAQRVAGGCWRCGRDGRRRRRLGRRICRLDRIAGDGLCWGGCRLLCYGAQYCFGDDDRGCRRYDHLRCDQRGCLDRGRYVDRRRHRGRDIHCRWRQLRARYRCSQRASESRLPLRYRVLVECRRSLIERLTLTILTCDRPSRIIAARPWSQVEDRSRADVSGSATGREHYCGQECLL